MHRTEGSRRAAKIHPRPSFTAVCKKSNPERAWSQVGAWVTYARVSGLACKIAIRHGAHLPSLATWQPCTRRLVN